MYSFELHLIAFNAMFLRCFYSQYNGAYRPKINNAAVDTV